VGTIKTMEELVALLRENLTAEFARSVARAEEPEFRDGRFGRTVEALGDFLNAELEVAITAVVDRATTTDGIRTIALVCHSEKTQKLLHVELTLAVIKRLAAVAGVT
jgi:hypothetical protein